MSSDFRKNFKSTGVDPVYGWEGGNYCWPGAQFDVVRRTCFSQNVFLEFILHESRDFAYI